MLFFSLDGYEYGEKKRRRRRRRDISGLIMYQ
jgi:hypothetical protein